MSQGQIFAIPTEEMQKEIAFIERLAEKRGDLPGTKRFQQLTSMIKDSLEELIDMIYDYFLQQDRTADDPSRKVVGETINRMVAHIPFVWYDVEYLKYSEGEDN